MTRTFELSCLCGYSVLPQLLHVDQLPVFRGSTVKLRDSPRNGLDCLATVGMTVLSGRENARLLGRMEKLLRAARRGAALVVQAYDLPMADSYPCPRCEEDVPTHGVFTSQPSTGSKVPPADQQHAECPRCRARLYRSVAIEDKSWRLVKGREQPPWDG